MWGNSLRPSGNNSDFDMFKNRYQFYNVAVSVKVFKRKPIYKKVLTYV